MTGEPVVVSGPVSPVDRLDLAAVEADLETPFVSALLNGASTGDGPTVRTVRAVPALVAEVKRLREQSNSWQLIVGDYARRVERITSLDVLFDALVEAQYGGMTIGADEREAVAQLAEAVQPLLRAAFGGCAICGDPTHSTERHESTLDSDFRHRTRGGAL